jgi:putative redox protein
MANIIEVQVKQVSAATSEATIRSHRVLVDRPETKGGEDQGPMGGELLLAALGGCFMSNLLAAIRSREAAVANVRTRVAGTLAESPSRFEAIEMQVSADCEDRELLGKLVTIAERSCIVANTLRSCLKLSVSVEGS